MHGHTNIKYIKVVYLWELYVLPFYYHESHTPRAEGKNNKHNISSLPASLNGVGSENITFRN